MTDETARRPLDDAAFAACMTPLEPFEDCPVLAIAVSGGADSLALTLLADRWARALGGKVVGLTVDHGLRPESGDEARQTGSWLRARKIEHRILPWIGDKPDTGLQRRARDARYALLSDWCRRHRCLHLLTAHHRQDQAETVAIRKARQSGEAGLAGMAVVREMHGLRLLRPLLGIDKTRLEQTLRAAGQPWLDDPSNLDPTFTRNRLRAAGLNIKALADEAGRQGLRRQEADRRAANALIHGAIVDPAGFATLDPTAFDRLPSDLAADLLARLLLTIGGRVYPPRGMALSRLIDAMRSERPASVRTLADCRIQTVRDRWLICREHVSSERLVLEPRRRRRWDDRFVTELRAEREDLAVAALGDKARHAKGTLIQKGKSRCLAGVIKSGLPAIWADERLMAVPHLGLYETSLAPEDVDLLFCPNTPLANAPFMPHITA